MRAAHDERPDPVCIVAAVSEHHCLRLQSGQQIPTQPVIVRFTGRNSKPHGHPVGVNNNVKLHRGICNTSGMLVHAHHRSTDHLHRGIMCRSKCVHDTCPDPCPPSTDESIVAGCRGAIDVRKIAPRRTRPQYPKDTIENTPIIHACRAARLVW